MAGCRDYHSDPQTGLGETELRHCVTLVQSFNLWKIETCHDNPRPLRFKASCGLQDPPRCGLCHAMDLPPLFSHITPATPASLPFRAFALAVFSAWELLPLVWGSLSNHMCPHSSRTPLLLSLFFISAIPSGMLNNLLGMPVIYLTDVTMHSAHHGTELIYARLSSFFCEGPDIFSFVGLTCSSAKDNTHMCDLGGLGVLVCQP